MGTIAIDLSRPAACRLVTRRTRGEKKMKARREGGGGGEFDVIWGVVLNFLKGVRARMTVVDGERERR